MFINDYIRNGTLKYFQYKTFIYLESYEKSKTELENTLKVIKKILFF